jgi:hypothetical protein
VVKKAGMPYSYPAQYCYSHHNVIVVEQILTLGTLLQHRTMIRGPHPLPPIEQPVEEVGTRQFPVGDKERRGRWQRLGRNPRSSPFTWSQGENTSCKPIQLIAQEKKIAYLNVVNKRGQFKVNYSDAIYALSSKNYSIIYVLCNNVLDFFKNFEIYHEFFNERFSYFYDTRMESCGISLSADIIFKW